LDFVIVCAGFRKVYVTTMVLALRLYVNWSDPTLRRSNFLRGVLAIAMLHEAIGAERVTSTRSRIDMQAHVPYKRAI
jgi:hypothetical protein